MSKMHLFMLLPSLDVGGAERQAVELARGLTERGHRVTVALFYHRGKLLGSLPSSVRVVDLKKKGKTDITGFIRRLKGEVKASRPDVLYSFLTVSNLALAALKALGVGLPIVWSVRSSEMRLSEYGLLAQACRTGEIFLSRCADLVIANSRAGAELSSSQGMQAARMRVVQNGIDTRRFIRDRNLGRSVRREWGVCDGDFLFGIVARIDPIKDHETFLRAAAALAEDMPEACFVCVGGGDAVLADALEKKCDELGLSRKVRWVGGRSDMVNVYNALDALCLTSLGEGFPNVLGEAMACGVPCVATDVGDSAEILGGYGRIVERGDWKAFAAAMAATVGDGVQDIPKKLRGRIVDNYSLSEMVAKTEGLLTSLAFEK